MLGQTVLNGMPWKWVSVASERLERAHFVILVVSSCFRFNPLLFFITLFSFSHSMSLFWHMLIKFTLGNQHRDIRHSFPIHLVTYIFFVVAHFKLFEIIWISLMPLPRTKLNYIFCTDIDREKKNISKTQTMRIFFLILNCAEQMRIVAHKTPQDETQYLCASVKFYSLSFSLQWKALAIMLENVWLTKCVAHYVAQLDISNCWVVNKKWQHLAIRIHTFSQSANVFITFHMKLR